MRFILCLIMCLSGTLAFGRDSSLNSLKKELDRAHKTLSETKKKVMRLEESIARREIARIRGEISQLENRITASNRAQYLSYFAEQREILSQIILRQQECALEAQSVLDLILMFITQLSDGSIAQDEGS